MATPSLPEGRETPEAPKQAPLGFQVFDLERQLERAMREFQSQTSYRGVLQAAPQSTPEQ